MTTAAGRFELLARNTHDAFWDWNMLSGTIWWNEGFSILFGYKEAETPLNPEQWINYIHHDDRDRIVDSINKAIENCESVWQEEYRFRKADGSYADVYDRGFTVVEEGKVVRILGSMMDITERVKRRNEKYENEERLRLALDSAELGIWDFDIQHNLLSLDNRCKELYGFTHNENVLYRQLFVNIYSFDKARVEKSVSTAHDIKSGGIYEVEFRTVDTSNGKHRWLRCKGKVYFTEEGKAYRFTGTALDISEQKRKDQVLQDVEKRFQIAFDNASLGIVLTDSAGRFLQVNKAFSEMIGYTQNELYGDSFEVVTYPEDLPDNREKLRQLKNAEIPFMDIKKRYIRKDGSILWVNLHTTLIFNTEGKPDTFFSIIRDITEERAVEMEQQKLLTLVNNSEELMSVMELSGLNSYLNKAGKELLGFDTDQQIAKTPMESLYTRENFELVQKEVFLSTLKKGRWSGTIMVKHLKTGEIFPVHNSSLRIDDPLSGEPIAIGTVMRDLRPEREAQKALAESEQLLRNLTATVPTTIWMCDETANITYVNQTWINLTGRPFESHMGTGWADNVLEEDRERVIKAFMGDVKARKVYESEFRISNAAGATRWCVVTGRPQYDTEGNFTGYIGICTDITERIENDLKLKASEERFRSMMEQSPVAIGVLRGKKMLIEAANGPLLHLWGKDESVIGLPLIKGLPELEGQPFLDLLNTVFETGREHKGFETLARLERRGKIVDAYFNYVYSPMREGDGSISGVMVVATEVTEQVIAKKELEKSEQRFRNLVRDAPIPIGVYIGKEMVIQLANKAVLDTWGKDISVIGKTFRQALPELEGQPFFELLDKVYATGIPYKATEDKVDLFIDGRMQTFFFNFTYKPLRDSHGNIYGIINTASDVTEFVRAREGLKEAEEKLRMAVESAEMGTWNIDLRTGEIKVSERLNQLFGYNGEKINLGSVFTVVHPADRERVEQKLYEAIRPGSDGLYEDEYTIVNVPEQREYIIRSIGKVYFEEGKPQYITGTVQDITNRKMNEQLLETQVQLRTEELKNANRFLQRSNEELEQFAYVASHDLQEPLRKIRMFSAMLKEMNTIEQDITARNYLSKVISSAERMSNLIMDLLNFSRISIDTDLKIPVDLNQVVNQVKEDFELLIKQKNAVVHVGELPTIEAIPLQMNQLFYNLLGNGLKFTADDRIPQISVSSRLAAEKDLQMFPHLLRSRSYCMISIKDNGIGFESDLADKIFTIFQRLHIRSQYEGTGIGLALCKKIVVQHGGAIWANAEPDKGAEFCMMLPIAY